MKSRGSRRRSIAAVCALYFVIYSCLLLLVYAALQYGIGLRMESAFPVMDDFLEYEPELRAEDYQDIPMRRFARCGFVVFDGAGKIMYASSGEVTERISFADLPFLRSYGSETYYSVYAARDGEEGLKYHILEHSTETAGDLPAVAGSCTLNQDLQMTDCSLFPGRDHLTEREFSILKESAASGEAAVSYTYLTDRKEMRTLVFTSPQLTEEAYLRLLSEAQRMWLFFVPAAAAGVILFTFLLHRKIRRGTAVLNEAIRSCRKPGGFRGDRGRIPAEFADVLDTLDHLMRKLDELTRDRQRIIADISHDLRTPLTVIGGCAQAFADGKIPPEEEQRYMGVIRDRAKLASSLIDSLFEYAKMEHPDYIPVRQPLDFCEFVKEYLADRYPELEQAGFVLHAEIPEVCLTVCADAGLMRRILDNLIGNALRCNPAGTAVTIRIREEDGDVSLCVADDGVGIPPALASRIFEPFMTGDAARRSGGGTGLGLSIVEKAVLLQGGTIELKIPPETGFSTAFIMMFPLADSGIGR